MTTENTELRDALFALLVTLKATQGYSTVRKTPVRQLQPTDVPALTIVQGDEDATADGDATAGPPRFVHAIAYHISVLRGFDDPVALDGQIDADMDAIQNLILRDPAFNASIEGILGYRRTRVFPQVGDGYYVELRFELTVQTRSSWNPVVTDNFAGMNVLARPAASQDDGDYNALLINTETCP